MRPPTNPRSFERYMRWGMLAFGVMPAPVIVATAGVMPVGPAVVFLGSGFALCAVLVWYCWRILGALSSRQIWTRPMLRRTWVLMAVAVGSTAAILLVGGSVRAGLWPYPMVLALSVIAVGLRFWQLVLGGLGMELVLFAGSVWLAGGDQSAAYSSGVWVVAAPLLIFTGWSSGWMLRVMADLREAREAAAWLATSAERARISRDLHDLFGQTLSTIAVKSELAAELARRGRPERAVEEMRAVHELSRESGDRVRAVVRGDRDLELPAEVAGAQSVLHSAGIDCRTAADHIADQVIASKLAWVLREAVTNILRHSSATWVRIELAAEPIRLVIVNDHPHAAGEAGGGLLGIRDRLAEVDGVVEWHHRGDEFELEVTVAGDAAAGTDVSSRVSGAAQVSKPTKSRAGEEA